MLKKYRSLSRDLLALEHELLSNPKLGTPLGYNAYKIRLKISSKGKGKSGGARVVSLVEEATVVGQINIEDEVITVNLIAIYDKSDTATISDKELKELIKALQQEE